MRLNKTIALLLMTLMAFSAVPVLAQEDSHDMGYDGMPSGMPSGMSDIDRGPGHSGDYAGDYDTMPDMRPRQRGPRGNHWFGGIPDEAKLQNREGRQERREARQERRGERFDNRIQRMEERFPGRGEDLRACFEQCMESSITGEINDAFADEAKRKAHVACKQTCGETARGKIKADRKEFKEKFKELHEERKEAFKNLPKIKDIRKELKEANGGKLSKDDKLKILDLHSERRALRDKYNDAKLQILDLKVEKFRTPRVIARAELTKINRAMDRAREQYQTARKGHLESRKELELVKDEYRDCFKKAESVTDEETRAEEIARCKGVRTEFTGHVKDYLVHTSELVLEALNKLKYQVKSSEHIDAEKAAAMLEDIESRIAKVKDAQDVVEKLDDDADKEQLKEAAATIKGAWKGSRAMFKKKVGNLMNAKLGNIVHQMENLQTKFSSARDRLKERGADVTDLDTALAGFDDRLNSAKENYEKAVALFKEAKENSEVSDATKEAHEMLKKARADVRDAKKDLRSIVKEIRTQAKELRKAAQELADTADVAEQVEATGEATE